MMNIFFFCNAFENAMIMNIFSNNASEKTAMSILFLHITTNLLLLINTFINNSLLYNLEYSALNTLNFMLSILILLRYIYIFIYNLSIDYLEYLTHKYYIYIFYL